MRRMRRLKSALYNMQKGEIKIPANPKKIADLSGSTEELLIFGMKPIITANTSQEKIDAHIEKKLKRRKTSWFCLGR